MLANGHHKNLKTESKMKPEDVSQEPAPLEKFNSLIHLQHVRGETTACMDMIKKELKRSNGNNEYALYKQGVILREEGKIQEALESFQKCLKLNPENADNLKEAAKCLYEMRRFKLSMEAYLEAERVSKNPDWEIYYYLGQCLMKLGDTGRAKEYAHKAVKTGKYENCYALLVKILLSEGDLNSAVAVSNAAVESCPDSVSMLTESGVLFLKMGQSQHAFERLSSALALEPTHTKALLGIGCITQKHEEYDVALSKYKIAIHYEPDSVALWNNIGMCFYSKQKYVAVEILLNLTAALMELKDPENATRAFRQALVLSPDDPVYVVNTAVSCHGAGYANEASDLLQRLKTSIENGVTCTPEVMALADGLSVVIDEKEKSSECENIDGASEFNQAKKDVLASRESIEDETGRDGTDIPSLEFPSGGVNEHDLEPDEV